MNTYALDEDQRQIQDLVRRLAREKVAQRAADIDRTAEYPQDMFDLLRELGLFTIPFPKEYGGSDSMLSASVAVEELGRVCYNTAYLLIVQWVPFGAILAAGSDEQKRRLLGPLAAGELHDLPRRLQHRAAERLRRRRHPHPGHALRGRLPHQRLEDLVHQFPHR